MCVICWSLFTVVLHSPWEHCVVFSLFGFPSYFSSYIKTDLLFLCSVDRASRYNPHKWPTWRTILFSYMFIPNLYMFQALMLIIRRINCIDIWYMSLYVSDHLVCRFGRNPENQKKNCVSSWSFTRIMTTFLSEVISCGQFICSYVINVTLLHAFLLQTDTFSPTDRHLFSYRPIPSSSLSKMKLLKC